jgi:alpha-1,2-mannosyltransferase
VIAAQSAAFASQLCFFLATRACSEHFIPGLQFSLWNFVRYNVFGGGDSALYGVEGPSFYMRNGLNNLNFILPLGLIYPLVALLDLFQVTGELPYLLL